MKFSLVALVLLLGLLLPARAQQEADEKYIAIFGLVQQAEDLTANGDPKQALASLTEAQSQLERFQKIYPDWNPSIVHYRLDDLAKKIAEVKTRVVVAPVSAPVTAANSPQATQPAQPSAEEQALRAQLVAAQAENQNLQAKLKEALSTQPATVDAGELTKAQDQLRALMKENELLKANASLPKAPSVDTNQIANLRRQVAEADKKVAEEQARAEQLAGQNATLQRDLKLAGAQETGKAQLALMQSNVTVMTLERGALENKVKQLSAKPESTEKAATTEITDLRGQLNQEQKKYELAQARVDELASKNASLQSDMQRAQSAEPASTPAPASTPSEAPSADTTVMTLERGALENKVKQLSVEVQKTHAGNYEGRIHDLTEQLDAMAKQLADAQRKNPRHIDADLVAMNKEVDTLRARVAVAEAKAVPYTQEELALLREVPPQPKLASAQTNKRSIHELPAGTAELVASAQRHFANHEFDQAEADYQKILEQDPANGLVLANLATIELQEDKLADAEKHITAALAQSPNDAYDLCTMGYLKFRQEKYDEALDILSRAAKLDPTNPEIQNYLGVTLSHKGLRVQAETALRKAVQLNPLYAPAHNNLAVVYLNQTPSMPLLARWHYQKAIAAGQPRNPDLEKLLAEKGAPYEAQ